MTQEIKEIEPKIEKTEFLKKRLAATLEPFEQKSLGREIPKYLFVFLTALIIATFSGVIILILKKD
ncbi:MAG: hypothetical protein QME57_00040 [Patescibacteria group bacterium]|nr:hypothetical protein [Patescibacteria group bacterium]